MPETWTQAKCWIKVRSTAEGLPSAIPLGYVYGPILIDPLPPILDGSWEECDGHVCREPDFCEWASTFEPTLLKRLQGWLRGGKALGWPYGKVDGGYRVPDLRARMHIPGRSNV
jgi:hypothetical protein